MIKAKLRHLRISPRKVRLVANLIKGLTIEEAERQLKFLTKRAALPILKLLNSAVANAENNNKLTKENLYISNIVVDVGPSLKRWRPRAMGRAFPILKRTSHITLTLDQKAKKDKEVKEPIIKKQALRQAQDNKKESVVKEETIEKAEKKKTISKKRLIKPKKPYRATSQSKKRFFSRQTFGNAKKLFRRKSI